MAKRKGTTRAGRTTATSTSDATTTQAMEPRVVAFAEQLGRMVGTVQTKAEGWMDRETLYQQLSGVRDGAVHLLEQLARAANTVTKKRTKKPATTARGGTKGRSGGVVDAPGKKHRKQPPADPGAAKLRSQEVKKRTALTMAKTNRHRGRG
jgi:hypothetical protein